MRVQCAREPALDGPMSLQLWPQPAVVLKGVRLSEPGQPAQPLATFAEASLALRLEPLLVWREIQVDSVSASGVKISYRRDADGRHNIGDLLERAAGGPAERVLEQRVANCVQGTAPRFAKTPHYSRWVGATHYLTCPRGRYTACCRRSLC
jgi:uncharacterized protein involved in outer membrane biogenesis